MDTTPLTPLFVAALGLLGAGLGTSCAGSDEGLSPDAAAGSAASRAPESDGRVLLYPLSAGPDPTRAAVLGEASEPTPVLLGAQFVPPVGGGSVFFQSDGDYRQCGRMEAGVEYGLARRFGSASEARPEGSLVTLDVGLMATASEGELEKLAEGQSGHYSAKTVGSGDGREKPDEPAAAAASGEGAPSLAGRLEFSVRGGAFQPIELSPGWSSVDLPVPANVPLEDLLLRCGTGARGHVLVGNARVRHVVAGDSEPSPPTVLFVTFDTSRADHFSSINRSSASRTPHFDGLAAEGVLYTNCFSATNITNPSHVTLMTGVSPRDTKIVNNKTPLHHSAGTLAETFEASGYQTYAVLSAFHLGHELSGLGQGFHRLDTTPNFARSGEETLAVAQRWIEESAGSPLFLWVHLFDPHAPYRLPDSRMRKLLEGRADPYAGEARIEGPLRVTPRWVIDEGVKDPDFVTALYGGGVEYLDDLFGRLLKADRMRGATVVATADHGEGLGERDVWWDHSGAFHPMLHVPLAIRDPRIAPGQVVTAPVQNWGAAARLLELMDLPFQTFPGAPLPIPAELTAAVPGAPEEETTRYAMSAHGSSVSITEGPYTLEMFLRAREVGSSGRQHAIGSCYLYHRENDPACRQNLVAEEYERAVSMRERLLRWVESAEITGMNPSNHDVSPAVLEKLASMGYSEGPEEIAKWWAPEYVAPEDGPAPWSKSPWNVGFTAPNGQAILEAAVAADSGR